MSVIRSKDLLTFLNSNPSMKKGCLVDTNILFAANYSFDRFHEPAIEIFDTLIKERVPRFVNVNVRSEFINLTRKVVIAHALMDAFHAEGKRLPYDVYNKLKSIRKRSLDKENIDSLFRIQDSEIESVRNLFINYYPDQHQDLWDWFCEDHLVGKIASEWNWVEEDFGINFLNLRHAESYYHLIDELRWSDAVSIVERTAIVML